MLNNQTYNLKVNEETFDSISIQDVLIILSDHFAEAGDSAEFLLTSNCTGEVIEAATPCFIVNGRTGATLTELLELLPYINRMAIAFID